MASIAAYTNGLISFSSDAIITMLDKIKTRKAIQHKQYSPFFCELHNKRELSEHEIKERLPLILKNPLSAGSKGVVKANTYEEYVYKFDEIRRQNPYGSVLLEEFLEGTQYLVETITVHRQVYVVAIVEQTISYMGRFIVTGYKMILDYDTDFYRSMIVAVKGIIKLIGVETGPCHLEIRYVKKQWKLVEANPRISAGAMNALIKTAFGVNLVKEILKLALGQQIDLEPKRKIETFVQYVTVQKEGILLKVTGRNKAINCKGVKDVHIKPSRGQILTPPLSMGARYAYVIATGKTANEARKNAKLAASHIQFHTKDIDEGKLKQLPQLQRDLEDFYRHIQKG